MAIFKGFAGKISVVIMIAIVGLIGVVTTSLWVVQDLNQTVLTCTDKRIPITHLIGDLRVQLNAVNRMMWQLSANPESADAGAQITTIRNRIRDTDTTIGELEAIGLVPRNRQNLEKVKEAWAALRAGYTAAIERIEGGQRRELAGELNAGAEILAGITPTLVDMGEVMAAANAETRARSVEIVKFAKGLILATGLVVIVLALASSGGLLASLVRSLNFVSETVDDCAHHVVTASEELAKSSGQLSVSSTESAVSLTQTATSLREIEVRVTQTTKRTEEARDLGEAVAELARKGETQVGELLRVVNEIKGNSGKIEEIVRLIDDVALQINLLSLNASVEASRAGEHGKGFGVVADAIRNLANGTAGSARQISEHVEASHQATTKGAKLTTISHELMQEITAGIGNLQKMISDIAEDSQEQLRGLEEISTATTSLDTAIQMNASSATEAASVAEELTAQGHELRDATNNLKTLMRGPEATA